METILEQILDELRAIRLNQDPELRQARLKCCRKDVGFSERLIKSTGNIFVSSELVKSSAWITLPVGISPQIYLLFLDKQDNEVTITFTYREAERIGITAPRFTRAIDALVEHGFLDIIVPGGINKEKTQYVISERWKKFGQPSFMDSKRTPCKQGGPLELFFGKAGVKEKQTGNTGRENSKDSILEECERLKQERDRLKEQYDELSERYSGARR